MEAAVLLWFHLLLFVIFCNGFHVQGPSGPLTVQLGDSVMLPCFVETPLPMEELEVEWKIIDPESLVHLWQNGESRPESQNQRYHERAHFFSEEVAHGNFSLLLTNVTREDAGVYKCVVHTNQHSDETLIEIMETERLIVSGGHVISAYAGEEITLNCSVDSHIPSEKIEEVSWKKQDEDLLLLLYQEGDILTGSTHGRFKGRVEFFSTEDRNKGNFSMRLKDVRFEDKGLYICSAISGTLSDKTTVEVQQLGFSSKHIWIFVLCVLGFVFGLILGILSYTAFHKKDRAHVIQCAFVLCPNIIMFIVFILWGVTEGSINEAATCSALNFVRILFLFWIADHLKLFKGFRVQGPSGSPTVQLGDSVMLPCFVETPLPVEELKVEWKRIDSGSLVHLWQNGESQPESQNQRYHERAHFFSEKVAHGNFSLLLTNVTREDAGVYKCVVHTNQHSNETLIEIIEFGYVHKVYKRLAVLLQYAVISFVAYFPVITRFWHTERTSGKTFILIFCLLWFILIFRHVIAVVTENPWNKCTGKMALSCDSRYLECRKNNPRKVPSRSYISTEFSNLLQIYVIAVIYGVHIKENICFVLFPLLPCSVFGLLVMCKRQNFLLNVLVMMILESVSAAGSIYFHYNFVTNVKERDALTCLNVLLYILTVMTLFNSLKQLSVTRCPEFKSFVTQTVTRCPECKIVVTQTVTRCPEFKSVATQTESDTNNTETHQLTRCPECKIIVTHTVTRCPEFKSVATQTESDTNNTETHQPVWSVVVFLIGSVLVVLVNAAALSVELILKARTGQRTVDLRVIVILTECVFALFLLAVQITFYCISELREDIKNLQDCCRCKKRDSNSHQPDNEREPENQQNTESELQGLSST
ncbi:uncharacterized protein LOC124389265 isoform X2 [Silurus meridionalis]|uniref:uncharacterized protein LOC124389265 isoform X2 n=1 Tax=Silurus meridionalis TaxID=175797 RepID=UPI001EEC37B0|nr:uncharacterized protein LOC124389265 isoform X2 [Silurus meridionalis]